MKYVTEIQDAGCDPAALEALYQHSLQANEEAEFRADLQQAYQSAPDNLLFSAWQSRFAQIPMPKARRVINWGLAIIVGVVTGLLLWSISSPEWLFINTAPYILFFWSPIATIPAIIFLAVVSKKNYAQVFIACLGLVIASVYVLLLAPTQSDEPSNHYLILMLFQLPLLCWIALGVAVMGFRSSPTTRFAFLIKSIEVMIAAGVYLIFGMALGGISLALFGTLSITPPELIIRLVAAGGFGLIPIMAVATMYDPEAPPDDQDFSLGLSRFVFTMVRLLLPLALLVLVIYIFVIPFNFLAPFKNRDLLIVYNVMQFAIVGLLIGATPLKLDDLSPRLQVWLRRAIIAVAVLALLISLYALSAVLYRTFTDALTLNRTTIIGWNVINIAILLMLVTGQFRKGASAWHERLQAVFSQATGAYMVWSLLLILLLPLVFK